MPNSVEKLRIRTIGRKIRDNETKHVPFMLIVGEKEAAENKVSVRKQGKADLGAMTIDEFKTFLQGEVNKELHPEE